MTDKGKLDVERKNSWGPPGGYLLRGGMGIRISFLEGYLLRRFKETYDGVKEFSSVKKKKKLWVEITSALSERPPQETMTKESFGLFGDGVMGHRKLQA